MDFSSIAQYFKSDSLALKGSDIEMILVAAAVFAVVSLGLGALARLLASQWLKTRPQFKPYFLKLKTAIWFLGGAVAFSVAVQFLPGRFRIHPSLAYGSKLLLILAAMVLIDRTLRVLLRQPGALGIKNEGSRDLAVQIARLGLVVLAILVMLDTVGISITPILASLGVSSIAIALALQDTLSNFFSGIYLLVDQPIRLGDYVRGPEGTEGYVRRIGWRSTRIENGAGHTVILPNSKLSSAIITNFDVPTREVNYPMTFLVDFEADPVAIETATRGALNQIIQEHPGVQKHLAPGFNWYGPRDNGIEVQVSLRLSSYTEASSVRHSFFKILMQRFRESDLHFGQTSSANRKVPAPANSGASTTTGA